MYIFTNIIGSFVVDKGRIVDSILFSDVTQFHQKGQAEAKLGKKHNNLLPLPPEKTKDFLLLLKNQFHKQFYLHNVTLTKESIHQSVNEDNFISQAIANINELDRVSNTLVKRLREWYSLYHPELSKETPNHEQYVQAVLTKKVPRKTMGGDLAAVDVEEILLLAKEVSDLFHLRKRHEIYLKKIMEKYCPNILELAGTTIGAGLLELAKSLKRLALLPSSTIQLLGAEKALFRHIKTGARSPKFGIIHAHPLVQGAGKNKGKAARMVADKLSLCARLDYFKGGFKAKEYRKELEGKL